MTKNLNLSLVAAAILVFLSTSAKATPLLQLFIEAGDTFGNNETFYQGSSNPDDPDTWVRVGDSSTPFRIWTIAKGSQGNKTYEWTDMRFAAVFDTSLIPDNTPSLTWNPITGEDDYLGSGFNISTPDSVTFSQISSAGDTPWPSSANPSGTHGQYGDGRTWVEWDLGTMSNFNTNVADFQPQADPQTSPFFSNGTNFPDQNAELGQINVYEVFADGLDPGQIVHFDFWGTGIETDCTKGDCIVEAVNVFSHDARWEQAYSVSEPAAGGLALLGLGMIGVGSIRGRHITKQRKLIS